MLLLQNRFGVKRLNPQSIDIREAPASAMAGEVPEQHLEVIGGTMPKHVGGTSR